MNQTHTTTMPFGIATIRPDLSRWWTEAQSAISAAAQWASTSPAAAPEARAVYHSYLEDACMAREMDRL